MGGRMLGKETGGELGDLTLHGFGIFRQFLKTRLYYCDQNTRGF